MARSKRYRLLQSGNEYGEHVPTVAELCVLKNQMYDAADRFRAALRKSDGHDQEQVKRDKTMAVLKKQVLDLNDKFDYFICMMLKNENLPVTAFSEPPKKDDDGKAKLKRKKTGKFGAEAEEKED